MTSTRKTWMLSLMLLGAVPALAQQSPGEQQPAAVPAPNGPEQGGRAVGPLVLLFDTGSVALNAESQATLDEAARLYREGRPISMTITGSTDRVGSAEQNLLLSQRRANAVLRGLLARGLLVERSQILAKGASNPAVPTPAGVAEAQNRRVEISWR